MRAATSDLATAVMGQSLRNVLLVGALLGSTALGFVTLGMESLWFDEAWSVELAKRPVVEQFREYLTSGTEGGPVYHILLHYWISIFGTSEFAARALSTIAQVGVVGLSFALVRKLAGDLVAVVSTFLVAASPALVYFSQEARNYSLLMFFFLLSLWLFVEYLWSSRRGPLIALGIVNFVGISTHIFMVEVIFVECLVMVAVGWKTRSVIASFAVVHLFVSIALVPYLMLAGDLTAKAEWVPVPNLNSVMNTALLYTGARFLENPLHAQSSGVASLSWTEIAHGCAMAALVLFGVVRLVRGGFASAIEKETLVRHRIALGLFVGMLVVVPTVPLLMSIGGVSYFVPRYLIMAVPAFAALAAIGAVQVFTKPSVVGLLAACLVGLSLQVAIADLRIKTKDNWRSMAALIESNITPRALLIVSDGRAKVPLDYYYKGPVEAVAVPGHVGLVPNDPALIELEQWFERSKGEIWLVMPWGGEHINGRVGLTVHFASRRDRYHHIQSWRGPGSWGGVLVSKYSFTSGIP